MTRSPHILLSLLTLLLLLPLMTACRDDDYDAGNAADDCSIAVRVPFAGRNTRAEADFDPEFAVEELTLFFFRSEGHDDATSPCIWKYDLPRQLAFNGINQTVRQVNFAFPMEVKDALFGGGATDCVVYALANYSTTLTPDALEQLQGTSLTSLTVNGMRALVSETRYSDSAVMPRTFLMDARTTLPYRQNKLTGTISLERLASRIMLRLHIPDRITVTDVIKDQDGSEQTVRRVYHSTGEGLHSWISYACDRASLDCNPDNRRLFSQKSRPSEGNGYKADGEPYRKTQSSPDISEEMQDYVIEVPFYSYPHQWNPTVPQENTFVTLCVYWEAAATGGAPAVRQATYYKIGIQAQQGELKRNHSYELGLTLGRLGSTEITEPIEVTAEWQYDLEWNTKQFNTSIKELRYLLLNNNDFDDTRNAYVYEVNNATSLSIPFHSSHPVMIESIDVEWDDVIHGTSSTDLRKFTLTAGTTNFNNRVSTTVAGYRNSTHFLGAEINNTDQLLDFCRDLVHFYYNGTSTSTSVGNVQLQTNTKPICPYRFTFHLRHADADGANIRATVEVVQYPAIYVTRVLSGTTASGTTGTTRYINGYNSAVSNPPSNKGYVDNASNLVIGDYHLGTIHNYETGYVGNRNVYTIHISKFASLSDDYIIADPRSRVVNNYEVSGNAATGNWTRQGADISGGNKYLTHYYPTLEGDDYKRYIAPSYSVASQWGVTRGVSEIQARRRCASYQEEGKPAGRWRLPTHAEIEFIANLSAQGLVPYLFGGSDENASYWTGSGAASVNNTASPPTVTETNSANAVRCVYDDWYWGNDNCALRTFTWGDKPRDETRARARLRQRR